MIISLISAIATNNAIGKNNALLWHLPDDFKHFKSLTSGHPIIMGRKTFESIGRALPNRRNIVITRDNTYKKDGIETCSSLDDALEQFKNTDQEIFVIGGGQLYSEAIDRADRLYITHVDTTPEDADTFFPVIDPQKWEELDRNEHSKDETHACAFTFVTYTKKV
jgi:dihydrofolate reductase